MAAREQDDEAQLHEEGMQPAPNTEIYFHQCTLSNIILVNDALLTASVV
jgi:hypothetical protein